MRRSASVTIDRPPEEVFAYVTDLARTPEWRATVLEAEALDWTDGTPAVGRRFRAVTRVAGRRWRWVLEVTEHEPPERFAYRVAEGSYELQVAYRCEPEGTGCRFTMVGRAGQPDGAFGRQVVPLLGRLMAREMRGHLLKLKRVLEA
jgi:uncharacterized protein YndB with AHSA1/START domain